jgi:hypothetical protein
MGNRKRSGRSESECGTLLVFAPHRATDSFLRYVRTRSASLDWSVVDRWSAERRGFLILHMNAAGENMFELVAKDARELMAKTLRQAASRADDVTRTQAGGIGSQRTLEAVNAQWVALGGITNPQFDPAISLH